jgi:predicted dehydrogenase
MSVSAFGWGILGPGRIARQFAAALSVVSDAELVAVAGRDAARARAFAAAFGAPRAHGDPARLLDAPEVDAVYIATPHHAHAEWVRRCLLAGKAVLCEKPLAVNAAQAEALVALARQRGVLLMEAMWTRLQPAWQQVRRWLREGVIGEVRGLTSSFGTVLSGAPHERWLDPLQAGGALLDIGIYNLSLSQWVLEREPQRVEVSARHARTGVDAHVAATLHYAGGARSQFACSFEVDLANDFHIAGSAGSIHVAAPFWCTPRLTLSCAGDVLVREMSHCANGYEHEIREAMRCIRAGELESSSIRHADTLATMRLMDAMRERIGVRYPFEDG